MHRIATVLLLLPVIVSADPLASPWEPIIGLPVFDCSAEVVVSAFEAEGWTPVSVNAENAFRAVRGNEVVTYQLEDPEFGSIVRIEYEMVVEDPEESDLEKLAGEVDRMADFFRFFLSEEHSYPGAVEGEVYGCYWTDRDESNYVQLYVSGAGDTAVLQLNATLFDN